MSQISIASKIAIAFIRPFRAYLDGYALIKNRRSSMEDNIKNKMDDIIEEYKSIYPSADARKIDLRKDYFYEISKMVLDRYEKSYDKLLPKVIDNLTISLENALKNRFTEDELVQLDILISNPIMHKLLSDSDVFGLLKDCELQMDYEIQMQMLGTMMGKENNEKIQDIISDLQNKYKLDADNIVYDEYYDEEDTDEDGWTENQ